MMWGRLGCFFLGNWVLLEIDVREESLQIGCRKTVLEIFFEEHSSMRWKGGGAYLVAKRFQIPFKAACKLRFQKIFSIGLDSEENQFQSIFSR